MKKNLSHMNVFLDHFLDLDKKFPLSYALCFLEIAQEEGMTLQDLVNKTRMDKSTLSRIISSLCDKRQKGMAFALLIRKSCADDPRKKRIYLSPTGQELKEKILKG